MIRALLSVLITLAAGAAPAYVGLENGFGLRATPIDNGGGDDGYLDLAGSVTTDFTASFDGQLFGQQMFLSLDSGSILQHPMGGDNAPIGLGIDAWPSLEYDSFLTMGGWTADASSPVLNIDGAVNIPGAPSRGGDQSFGSIGISRAYAPAPGTSVYDQTDYSLARLTLSGDAFGKLKYFGSWGDRHNSLWEFDVVAGAVSEPTLIDFNRPQPRPLPTPPAPEPVAPPVVIDPPVALPPVPPVSSPPAVISPVVPPLSPPTISQAPSVLSDGLYFGVDQYPTPGLDGFQTFDLTLNTIAGSFLSLGFDRVSGGGIQGPVHQSPGFAGTTSQIYDLAPDANNLADTRFLYDPTTGIAFAEAESDYGLEAVYGQFGSAMDFEQSSMPFVRIVTADPEQVRITGQVSTKEDRYGEITTHDVDVLLADIYDFVTPVAPPIEPPAEITPPSEPPVLELPLPTSPAPEPVAPPVEDPPVFDPPASEPPAADPVVPEPTTDPVVVDPEPELIDPVITLPGGSAIGHVWIPPENWDPYYMIDSPVVCDCHFEIDYEIDIDTLRGAVTPIDRVRRGDPIFTMAYDGVRLSAPLAFDAAGFTTLPAIPEPGSLGLLTGAVLAWRGRRETTLA